jgi:hypothetical protein
MWTKSKPDHANRELLIAFGTALLLFAICVIPASIAPAGSAEHQVIASHGPGNQALPAASFDLFFSVATILLIALVFYGRHVSPTEQRIELSLSRDAHRIRPPPSR